MKFYRPLPLDTELKISPSSLLISKTDLKGNYIYMNKHLCKISAYEADELENAPHNLLRHPDMPRAIFFKLWKELKEGNSVTILIKNLAKTGSFFWIKTEFSTVQNIDSDPNVKYIAKGEMATRKSIEQVEILYAKLLKIEKRESMSASILYLDHYLKERDVSFQEYMNRLLKPQTVMSSFFNKIKNGIRAA